MLQPIQFMVDMVFIPIYIAYLYAEVEKDPQSAWYGEEGHEFKQAVVILVLSVLNIFICFIPPSRCGL